MSGGDRENPPPGHSEQSEESSERNQQNAVLFIATDISFLSEVLGGKDGIADNPQFVKLLFRELIRQVVRAFYENTKQ